MSDLRLISRARAGNRHQPAKAPHRRRQRRDFGRIHRPWLLATGMVAR